MLTQVPDFLPDNDKTEYVSIWSNTDLNDHHIQITDWCEEQNINAEFIGMWMIADGTNQCSLWKINDPEHRMIFTLKWA